MVWNLVSAIKVQMIRLPNLVNYVAKSQEKASLASPLLNWTRPHWMYRICSPSLERPATTTKVIVMSSKNVERSTHLGLWQLWENFYLVRKVLVSQKTSSTYSPSQLYNVVWFWISLHYYAYIILKSLKLEIWKHILKN